MNETAPATRRPKRDTKNLVGLVLAVLMGVCLVYPACFILAPLAAIYHADEGFKRARRTINPEELRSWALQEIKKHAGTNDPDIQASEIPDYIQKLYSGRPEDALALSGAPEQSRVVILWGEWLFSLGS